MTINLSEKGKNWPPTIHLMMIHRSGLRRRIRKRNRVGLVLRFSRAGLAVFFPVLTVIIMSALVFAGVPASGKEDPEENKTQKLAPGVVYSYKYYPKERWAVHTIRIDISRDEIGVRLGKGLDHIAGLERVQSILHRYDSLQSDVQPLGGINANFWQAGTIHPIGPTAIDGQILIGEQHRQWSALMMTTGKQLSLDRYSVECEIRTRNGVLPIDRFNHRHDSLSRVIYTPFSGNTVPFLDTAIIALASQDTITDESENGNLAALIDSALFISQENGTLKVQFEYLKPTLVNTLTPCKITQIDTGVVAIPANGGVLSFGKGPFPLFFSLFVGDTFSLVSRIQPAVPQPVLFMTSGTPRLVREGRVSVEWQEEGLRKLRFVNGKYARSAIGISKDGKSIILMTVEASNRKMRRSGISLLDMAKILVDEGAYNAMNFDGGGSATMVVNDETVAPRSGTKYSRKISTALFVTRKKHEK